MLLHSERFHAIRPQLVQISFPPVRAIYPSFQPFFIRGFRLCLLVVLAKEIVISIVVPLNRRGMRAHWTFNYGTDQKSWDDRPIWIARNHLCSDDFLSRHNHSLGCAHTFQHYAEV